jgi:2-deoxy-D-gluconate 3-dehydrogenase
MPRPPGEAVSWDREGVDGKRDIPGLDEGVKARTPAGRWGEPEDMAGTAIFLASRASDFLTGAAIPVDGGFAVKV